MKRTFQVVIEYYWTNIFDNKVTVTELYPIDIIPVSNCSVVNTAVKVVEWENKYKDDFEKARRGELYTCMNLD